jgi:phage FluMu protein Com
MERTSNEDGIKFTYKPDKSVFSDFQLKVIPADHRLELTEAQNQVIADLITKAFPVNEITFELKNKIEFVDSGVNLETISCPKCGSVIETELWQEEMTKAHETNFAYMDFVTPCCKKEVSLNNLKYDTESGFSKYQVTVINPDYDKINHSEFVTLLEKQTGIKMKLIWAKY